MTMKIDTPLPCSPFKKALQNFAPPEDLTVDQWADKYRVLTSEVSAEPGPWRTSRTPYLYEPMRAFTDPKVHRIVIVASSQVGKALDIATPIATPDGFVTMGDLHVGSVVYDERGHECKVTAATNVMHDRPCYRVAFSDGSELIADANHLWSNYDLTVTKNTKEIFDMFMNGECFAVPSTNKSPIRFIVGVEPVASRPVRCIQVDSPNHLFLAGHEMIPTHNSEFELNILGFIMTQAPGSILYIQPYEKDAKKFSRQRIAPMIRDCPQLRGRVSSQTARDGGNTILQKMFPGGSLTMAGSSSAADLCSIPCKYIIGDERDRWEDNAGNEGDPWELAQARQITFYDRKAVEVSTPTIAGTSKIASSYELGTQERWEHQCPHCGGWFEITKELVAHTCEKVTNKGRTHNKITVQGFQCPECGIISPQEVMRRQPQRWRATNPSAYESGVRSFWLTAFASPWQSWETIFQKLYDNLHTPENLKVVYNTMLGRLWEDRHQEANTDDIFKRREEYDAELPEGVLALTCGVDTQDNRLEFEVVGWGLNNENWGIQKGFIMGAPDLQKTWDQLDEVLQKTYKFKDGFGLGIACTFIDSGGHYTEEVYRETAKRENMRVFAIKGRGGEGIPLVSPAKKVPTKDGGKTWLYILGVDAGKAALFNFLTVQNRGAKFCHFPNNSGRGYDEAFFKGLFSEKMERKKTAAGYKWTWVKLPGHVRNEALDCRNYAYAARATLVNDFEKLAVTLDERRKAFVSGEKQPTPSAVPTPKKRRSSSRRTDFEW